MLLDGGSWGRSWGVLDVSDVKKPWRGAREHTWDRRSIRASLESSLSVFMPIGLDSPDSEAYQFHKYQQRQVVPSPALLPTAAAAEGHRAQF